METAVVLLSGGIGSATAAFRRREDLLRPLYIDYGRASAVAERKAAAAVAEALETTLEVFELPHVSQALALRPGVKAERGRRPTPGAPWEVDGLMSTILAVGAEYAAAVGADLLITGQSAPAADAAGQLSQERTVDPREFHHAWRLMLETALPAVRRVQPDFPLLDLEPPEVLRLAQRLSVPLERTWSCHAQPPVCGTCPGCRTRAAAFAQAGVLDPLLSSKKSTD